MVLTSPATATARDLSSSPVAWRTAPLSGRTASDSAVAVARAAAVLLTGRGGAAERGRCGDIFSSVIDPRASFVACAAISGEVGVLSNVARCSCATTRVATQLLLDDVIVGCTAGTQHANTCTRACAPPLVAARATSMVRTLTLGGLSAHLAGAKRLDVGAGRGSRLLHGSATAAGRREVATRGVLDAADGPSIGASRPAAGSRAQPAAFDVTRTSVRAGPARAILRVPKRPPRRGCRSCLPAAGAGSCTTGAGAKPSQPEAWCSGRVAAARSDLGSTAAAEARLAPKGDRQGDVAGLEYQKRGLQ